jgi:TolB-like protein/Tfp pilus assembly protein PilF
MAYPLPEKPSIAVLPFENLSGDLQQEYLSDGISEAIISALSKAPNMFVIARNSSFTYKGKPVKVQQVAEELGVQYVLEGSVQKSGEKLRVTAQLIDALKGHHLWSERYDLKMDDLLDVQDEIAMNVLVETLVKLTEGEDARLLRRETNNLKAYEKFMEAGMYARRNNPDDNFKARQLGEEAIRLDPNFSGAYRLVGWCHLWNVWQGWSQDPGKSGQLATEYAQKALALDENNSENLSLWAFLQKDTEKTVEILRQAVEINPNLADVTCKLGGALFNSGRSEEAIHYVEKAIRLNPFPPAIYFRTLGLIYCFDGRYEEALVACKKALDMQSDDVTTLRNLTVIYIGLGQEEKARAAAAEVLRLDPNFSVEHVAKLWPSLPGGTKRFVDALRKAGLPDGKSSLPLPEKPSVAVLPFVNMSDDPKQAYFSDGITENIIMALSKTPKLFVIARNSTFAYKNKPINIKQAAEELGVRYILEGSVQKTENRVRITAQLIDATTGRHQWAERYDRELKDIFALQDEITLEIITALQVELTEGEQSRIHRGGTINLEAFLKIIKGREHHFRYTQEDMEIAKRMYKEAIALDPRYATAYFWLAYAIDAELNNGWSKSREKDIEQLFELSEKIFSLDDSSAQAHIVLSRFYAFTGQPDRAITEAEKAVDLNPNDADGYAFGGLALIETKRFKEAIAWFKKAIRRNPSPPIWYLTSLCGSYIASDQHHEAIAMGKKMVTNDPDRHVGYFWLGVCYLAMDNYEEAIAAFKEAINMAPTKPINLHLCAVALSLTGKHEEALGMMKKAFNFGRQESQDNQNMRLSHFAEYHRRIGLYEEAIDTGKKLLDSNPNNKHALRAYITLTCAYSALGKAEDADAAAAEVLRIIPDFSMEALTTKDSWFGMSFYDWFLKDEADKNLLVSALRKAGLK